MSLKVKAWRLPPWRGEAGHVVGDELVGALVVWPVSVNGDKESVTDTQDEGVSMLKL